MTDADPETSSALIDRLQRWSGVELRIGESLARHTTLRIGGSAELFVRLHTETALVAVLEAVSRAGIDFHLLGLGSNLLVPDEGLAGVVAVLEGEFEGCEIRGCRVQAGAGLSLARLVRETLAHGLIGLESLSGFPSTVGGAVVMNAGCYGVEIKDVLDSVDIVQRDGSRRTLSVEEVAPVYRSTALKGSGAIVVRATFELRREEPSRARRRLEEVNRQRRRSMPSGRPSAGSIFKNPSGDSAGRLIEVCGLKGKRRGDAQISVEHANVIVNCGAARAVDVLQLMVEAHAAVLERFGIALEPEVVLAGALRRQWVDLTASR